VGTPTADIDLVKILDISTKDAQCVTLDIKDFYLNTPIKRYKYMHLKACRYPRRNHRGI
jgi:hypothetical protein